MSAEDHCYACEGTHDEEDMLVCDHCLRKCCHMYCLVPPIEDIPHEPWYCDYCRRDYNIRSILQCANLFSRPEPQNRVRLRRQDQSNLTSSRENSIQSRGVSLPRSNRSNSNLSVNQQNPRDRAPRFMNESRRTRNNGSRHNQRRNQINESSSSESEGEQVETYQANPNFIRHELQRNRRQTRRPARNLQANGRSRVLNETSNTSNNRNQTHISLLQFPSRASSFMIANQINSGNLDSSAFDDEFRDNSSSPNLIPTTRDRAVLPRPTQGENLF